MRAQVRKPKISFKKEKLFKIKSHITETIRKLVLLPSHNFTHHMPIICVIVLIFISILYVKLSLFEKGYVTSDCAYYANMLWNTGGEKLLFAEYVKERFGGISYLNDHFSPTLVLLAIVYQFLPNPKMLLVIQTLVPLITCFILYACVSNEHEKGIPIYYWIVIWGYLFNPFHITATIDSVYGFHHDSLIPLFASLVYFAIIKKRFYLFICSLALLAGLKEDIPILLLFGSSIVYLKYKMKKVDCNLEYYKKYFLSTVIVSFAFIIIGLFLFPYFTRGVYGTVASGIIFRLRLSKIVQFDRSWLGLLFFLGGLFAVEIWILILPVLMLLSQKSIGPGDWHSFLPLIIMCIAAMEGYKRSKFSSENKFLHMRQVVILVTMFLLCFWSEQGIRALRFAVKDAAIRPYLGNYERLRELDGHIPQHAYVTTTNDLRVRYTNRAHLTWTTHKAEYVVINTNLMQRSFKRYGYDSDYGLIDYVQNSDKFIFVKSVDTFKLYRRNIRGYVFPAKGVQAP